MDENNEINAEGGLCLPLPPRTNHISRTLMCVFVCSD